jgi:hypothetical protein
MLHLLHSDKINEGKQVTLGIRRIISHGSTGNVRISGMNFTMVEKNMHHQNHLKIKHYLTQELKNIVLY